jgi:Holliday junction resolvase RusA-like endonuclease
MALAVKPISANAKRSESGWYTQLLQDAAKARRPQAPVGPLYARIIWFQRRRSQGDVDNIAKRILDSLKGIVIQDDDEIDRCLAIKTVADPAGDFAIDVLNLPSQSIQDELRDLLGAEEHVLYIEIGPVTDPTIAFGPVR